jgi:hypothetical protein
MTTDPELLRRRISKLFIDRTVGDVTERVFQREIAERTVDLYRAVIKGRLAEGEDLLAEHHAISSHFRVTQSLLKEPEQHATSLFLTNLRLLQLKSTVFPSQPPTADSRDATVIDEIRLDRLGELKYRWQFRLGEAGVGAVMCIIAFLLAEQLSFTGPVLIGLGALGILHSTLLPTRWVEIRATDGSRDNDPFLIHTVRKKSARKLLRALRERARKA